MAGRGARSERGNVRGALVDEFTHVIPGGITRNCVPKQYRGADGDGGRGYDYPGFAAIDFGRRGRWAGLVRGYGCMAYLMPTTIESGPGSGSA
jgi:hypothetical protein